MYITILGRQPAISIAELEALFGSDAVEFFGDTAALVTTPTLDVMRLGGTLKAGEVVAKLHGNWQQVSKKIVSHYDNLLQANHGKITLGISAYGFTASARDVQKTGIVLKQRLKKHGISLRLIPNTEPALSTATAHHNKLGLSDNKIELIVVQNHDGSVIVAESVGAQNITALARRDQERPRRDAFVGMLPPKLAQIMVNLAHPKAGARVLDPFCGTGVVLQEAALLGYAVYGTDLSEKMVRYSRENLEWLERTHHREVTWHLAEGDAMKTTWKAPIDAVVCEAYLGQPFSAPPSPAKLRDVRGNCEHIIGSFLKNLHPQLTSGTRLCIAVPAWRDGSGRLTHLPLVSNLEAFGYATVDFHTATKNDLIYYRENQVVARELLIIERL